MPYPSFPSRDNYFPDLGDNYSLAVFFFVCFPFFFFTCVTAYVCNLKFSFVFQLDINVLICILDFPVFSICEIQICCCM